MSDAAVSSLSWLVTGNKRRLRASECRFLDEPFIVSPREYIERAGL